MAGFDGAKALVIGGAGLIGSHIVDLLTAEDVREVVVYDNFCRGSMDNLAAALRDPRVRVFEAGGDILQTDVLAKATEGADYVFHLAALWLLQCHDYPRAAFDVNIRGTFNVLEACRDAKVKKLVFSSSASVYGDAESVPMAEDHPYRNKTFYGAAKIAGEQMARAFHHRYGLPWCGLRYMNVYGPRQDYRGAYVAVIMKVLDRIEAGLPPILHGDGSQTYDFIHVADCAHANLCAATSIATDRCYNVGSGVGTTLKELTKLILELKGSDLPISYEPQTTSFVTRRVGSTVRAENEIGFRAGIGLREGLTSLIAWRDRDKARRQARVKEVFPEMFFGPQASGKETAAHPSPLQ